MSWVSFCYVGLGKNERGEVFRKFSSNFAAVAIYNFGFEEV